MDPISNDTVAVGATCDLSTCKCVCDKEYCLLQPQDKGGAKDTDDMTCEFQCNCKKACNETTSWTGSSTASAETRCAGTCTVCTDDPTLCEDDEDCILKYNGKQPDSNGLKYCVESGFCTASKEVMCDDAYKAVSGKKNNRAKCCPDTRYVIILCVEHAGTKGPPK